MKILHVVPSYKPAYIYGGTIESIARLCEAEAGVAETVDVYTTTANGKTELNVQPNKPVDVDGVKVTYFKRFFKDPFYISPALWKALQSSCKEYDVVHIHSWWNMIALRSAFICKKQKVNTIISPRGMMSDYILKNSKRALKSVMHGLFGKSLLKHTRFHATSESEYKECIKLIKGWKGFIIPNIIWLPSVQILKKENPVFTIIFLSRIHPKKGIELLMEAISKLDKKPVLKIAGSGEEEYIQQLKQKAVLLNIENNIEWLGWLNREEKFDALTQADLFALTSYNENFANAVIESLYAGTPVLISDKIGLSSFVYENQLGWLCKLNSSEIANCIEKAMGDLSVKQKVHNCAQKIIDKSFSAEKIAVQYLQHYAL